MQSLEGQQKNSPCFASCALSFAVLEFSAMPLEQSKCKTYEGTVLVEITVFVVLPSCIQLPY